MLKNSRSSFGSITIAIHWISAGIIPSQFCLGLYMLSLEYFDPNYYVLPHYHKSIGILFAVLLFIRIFWSAANPRPEPVQGISRFEHQIAGMVQVVLLILLVFVVALGYLTATAAGDSIEVFNWFEVPATITSIENQEDRAGDLHLWTAVAVMVIASLHTLAALRHHYFNRDATLSRMLGKPVPESEQ